MSVAAVANKQLAGQAIINLVENALKYGEPEATGQPFLVEVDVVRNGDMVEVRVSDHGRGVAPGDRDRVMKRFVRLDDSRSTAGSGLGLSLVAAVARASGGRLALESNDPGLVAVFSLRGAPPDAGAGANPGQMTTTISRAASTSNRALSLAG